MCPPCQPNVWGQLRSQLPNVWVGRAVPPGSRLFLQSAVCLHSCCHPGLDAGGLGPLAPEAPELAQLTLTFGAPRCFLPILRTAS